MTPGRMALRSRTQCKRINPELIMIAAFFDGLDCSADGCPYRTFYGKHL